MGEKKSRLNRFIAQHPYCCLCGGSAPTETIEHAPPKVMFFGKDRPKGLEVPACNRCNIGTSGSDQIAAIFALSQAPCLMGDASKNAEKHRYVRKLCDGVRNNQPEVFGCFMTPHTSKECRLKKIDQYLFSQYLNGWACKQALAIWYDRTSQVFPESGVMFVRWYTWLTLQHEDEFVGQVERLSLVDWLQAGRKSTDDQFFYRAGFDEDTTEGEIFLAYHGAVCARVELIKDRSAKTANDLKRNAAVASMATGRESGIVGAAC